MFRAYRQMLSDRETHWLAVAAVVTLGIGTVSYMLLEHWTPVQSLYFSVMTLATVGYGDLHPTTELSQLFTIGYVLVGLGIIAGFVTELVKVRSGSPGRLVTSIRSATLDDERDADASRS